MENWEDKMHYVETVIESGLKEAFQRGDRKYQGMDHDPDIMTREAHEDIHHIRTYHSGVRLLEAEHAAEEEDYEKALEKIESAIGYLVILHYRVNRKLDEMGQ